MEDYGTAKKIDAAGIPSDVGASEILIGGSAPGSSISMALSAQLRTQTDSLHRQIETLLGLPDAVQCLDDYVLLLCKFFGLYRPLERMMASLPDWEHHGFVLSSPSQSDCLTSDLTVLGVDPASVVEASRVWLPALPNFAHALGALYVLEGSKLGGRIILPDINKRIGSQIIGASLFFAGNGSAIGQTWLTCKLALDVFGDERPGLRADVVLGASNVFRAITKWFALPHVITKNR